MATTFRSGIPTEYRRGVFRSRLEARWAAFFDLIGWRWTYEPVDAEGYIPDFLIHGPRAMFVEVGSLETKPEFEDKARKPDLAVASLGRDLLVVGTNPLPDLPVDSGSLAAGWFGEVWIGEQEAAYSWGTGVWAWCRSCKRFAVYHTFMNYDHRPCGGDGHDREGRYRDHVELEGLWAEAGNTVQWRP